MVYVLFIYVLSNYFSAYDEIATWFAEIMFRKKVTNINLNIFNYLGWTSLHYASRNGHQSVVELLFDSGSNIDQKDKSGEFDLSIFLFI